MGKSIRSKRLKRLRTLKRELVAPHYDEKEAGKNAIMEAALAAPKVELPKKRSREETMGMSYHPFMCFSPDSDYSTHLIPNRIGYAQGRMIHYNRNHQYLGFSSSASRVTAVNCFGFAHLFTDSAPTLVRS